jgi:polyribonucleotide nucleotidyltransferase
MLTAAMTEQISPVKVKKAVIAGKNEQSSDETITEFFKIPEDCVGLIIGNKGSTIRAIQEMSDTQISIQYFKKGSEESAVAALITGTASKRNVAKTEIERLITEKKEKQTKRPQGDKTETPPSKRINDSHNAVPS